MGRRAFTLIEVLMASIMAVVVSGAIIVLAQTSGRM